MTHEIALLISVTATIFWVLYKIFSLIYDLNVEKYPGFSSVKSDLRRANSQYRDEVEDRELRFERFAAWTECPECLTLDLHRIKDTLPHSCRRQCSQCNYVWRQI